MSVKPPDYEKAEGKAWRDSHRQVGQEAKIRTKRLLKRIATFISRFGYDETGVLEKIKTDDMFAAHFAKEPRRTGFHEKVAGNWIRLLPEVSDFEILPKSGPKSIKVSSDGVLVVGSKDKEIPGKSLDFKWTTGNTTFYAMHKYTKEGGGNQDSQYQEMIDLMQRFYHCRDKAIVLLVIVDGDYYQQNGGKRLEELKSRERDRPPKSFALPIEQVPLIVREYLR